MEYVKIPNIFKREEFGKNRIIEGEYSTPELKYLAELPWAWSEKVDGTNVRIIWDGHRVSFGGRTDNAQIPSHLVNRLNELFRKTSSSSVRDSVKRSRAADCMARQTSSCSMSLLIRCGFRENPSRISPTCSASGASLLSV